jgi:Sulfotransferase family
MSERKNRDPRPPSGDSRPKVIYVMGAGRSGSTILGVALGNCAEVFFAGELDKWLARSGVPRREDPELHRFWETVRREMGDAQDLFGGRAGNLERSSALLDPRRWPVRRRLRRRYRLLSAELYRAVASAAGTTHIVDTSHYPLRARELQALREIDLYLLFLVRDPQGVVASLGRDDVPERRFGMLTSNAYLWLTYVLAVTVFLRHPRDRRIFVRHEDFVEEPARVLRQILDTADSPAPVPPLTSLRSGVPFHGNRLVAEDSIVLEIRPAAPTRSSRVTSMLQLPWSFVFSRLRPAASASTLTTPISTQS